MKSQLGYVHRLALRLALGLVLTGLVLSLNPMRANDATAEGSANITGQSATLLPDGQWLMLGGEDQNRPLATAYIVREVDTDPVPLAEGLKFSRAWHTATVLPNGMVAVIGGIGAHSKPVSAVEEFDQDKGSFGVSQVAGITPRSRHSATLLSDGTVLIAGGLSASGKTLRDAQLWDPRTNRVTTVGGLSTPRSGHTAMLQSDGTVLVEGGVDSIGTPAGSSEIFNPKLRQFSPASADQSDEHAAAGTAPNVPELAGTIPAANATAVALDTIISLRFSEPMDVTTVDSDTVTLSGPDGAVSATVVAAEGGMLAFVSPGSTLAPNATYTVTVDGVMARDAVELAITSFSFKTGSARLVGPASGAGTAGSTSGEFNTAGVWIPTSDWQTHLPASRWQSLPPLRAPQGVTALSGQVLTIDGSPLQGVTLQVGAYSARSDGTGRFLISGLPAGLNALLIDGSSANHGSVSYGIFQPGVSVTARVTNVLPFTIWMPVLDTPNAVAIPVPTTAETVAVSPYIPGLELHLPSGSEIVDVNGQLVHAVTITPVPLDRPPFPLPAGVVVPIYFTVQPGLAKIQTPSGGRAGAWLVYPNSNNLPVGASFDFWNYGLSWGGWWVYGRGTVGAGGTQVFPNPGVSFSKFTGAMLGGANAPETKGCGSGAAGDPVDCSTGIFIYSQRDLRLIDVIPLNLQRTYLSQDTQSRSFGIGTNDSYEFFLTALGTQLYTKVFLIFPDGEKVSYKNTNTANPGDYGTANFVPTLSSDPAYYGSTITWNGNGWNLRTREGTIYTFPDSILTGTAAKAAVTSIKDRYGNTVTITRDGNGNKTQITSPNGRSIQFQHDSNNRIIQATDNLGRTVTYTYDSYGASGRPTCNTQGALCAVTDANGGITSFTYDGGDRMLTVTDPRGNTQITNSYDPTSGRVATQTLADGTSTYQFSYTPTSGIPITESTITDPNLNVEVKNFDGNGFLASHVLGSGSNAQQTFNFTRDPGTELVTSMTDQLGRETTYGYDTNGNLTNITRLAGTQRAVSSMLAYDPTFSQLTSITDPLSHTWTFGRDGSGNLTSVSDPLNDSITLTYDTEGRPLMVADAYNDTAQFGYSGADLSSITDPLGNTTTRYTDYAGRPFAIRDALGQFTGIIWDALDRITQMTDPNSNATSFAYDGNSNLTSVTDAKTNQTLYSYDSRNRPISRTDGLKVSESYGWDANSNLTSHTDRRGKVTAIQYDALNRRTFAGFGQSGSNYESTISYSWDGGNRLTGAMDSIAGAITRVPDLLDRFTSETTPQGSISYSYDNANRRQTMQVAGQPQVVYGWDNANRLTGITQGSSSVGINYDNANRRTSLTLPNGVTVAYGVDTGSRITGLTYSAGSSQLGNLTYGYDADGRVTSKGGTLASTNLPNSVTGNAFNADNGMSAFGGATLSYDANGNLTSDGTNTYAWDARNHLTGISGGATASFVYDAFGRRTQKTVNGPATQILYDGLNTVQEQNSINGTANFLTGLNIDEYFTRADSGNNVSTLLRDTLGSTVGLVGSGQSIATTYTYQPFGGTNTAGATNGNSYQFAGRENDGSGLYTDRARYYSPMYQRFISQDPAGFTGGDANLYVYVFNNPVVDVDPLGLGTFQVGLGISATGGDGVIGGGGTASIGLVIDGNGNVGVYVSVGGSLGTAQAGGLSVSGGIDQQVSNANCIKDLRGPFLETIGTVGPVSGDVFTGVGRQGQLVVGGGGVVGVGTGVSGQGAVTVTTVIPLGNVWNIL